MIIENKQNSNEGREEDNEEVNLSPPTNNETHQALELLRHVVHCKSEDLKKHFDVFATYSELITIRTYFRNVM